jgi:hypothetical protein
MDKCDSKKGRASLKKLRELTISLNDRDAQLKKNAKTLWVVIESLREVRSILSEGDPDIPCVVERIETVLELVETYGCKRVYNE